MSEEKKPSTLFLLNFKECSHFYNAFKYYDNFYTELIKQSQKDEKKNKGTLKYIQKEIKKNINIFDTTVEVIREKYGDEEADLMNAIYIEGMTKTDAAKKYETSRRNFLRIENAWLHSAEPEVVKRLKLVKGIHYGEPEDIKKPKYKYPKIKTDGDIDSEWKQMLRKESKLIYLYLKYVQDIQATIDAIRHNMSGVRSRPTDAVIGRGTGAVDNDAKYARTITKIMKLEKKQSVYKDNLYWMMAYMQTSENPVTRSILPIIYVQGETMTRIASNGNISIKSCKNSIDKAGRYPESDFVA